MNPDLLMVVAAGLLFLAIAGVGFAFAGGGDQAKTVKRVQTVTGSGRAERGRGPKRQTDAALVRRKQIVENLRLTERKERKQRATIVSMLRQAGLRPDVKRFWLVSAAVGVVLALLASLLRMHPIIPLGIGFAGGLGLPRWVLKVMRDRRQKKFTEAFPNAIDIIVRGIKSGLPVNDCLKVIARESPEPLASEFNRVVESISVGRTIDEALEKMYENMQTPEVKFLGIVMAIQAKTGGNLAEALNNLSVVLRSRKLMREKIKAMSSEAIASAMIIGSLPPGIMILVSVTSPGYMIPLFTDPRGHALLAGAAFWMGTGVFVMRRMINFKI